MKALTKPKIGSRWRHWKNGKTYTVVKLALFCAAHHNERLLVIHEDEEGGSFARSEDEWHNIMRNGVRRFTEVE